MPSFLRASILLFSIASYCTSAQAQKPNANFPTDDEIRLVLTQADRAAQQYKPLLDMEEKMLGAKGKGAVANDRDVVQSIELGNKGFGKFPQKFNGPMGFAYFEWLDDASRNAVLCAANASMQATQSLVDGHTAEASLELQLSQSCIDVSTLLYTVSENAGALYGKICRRSGKGR